MSPDITVRPATANDVDTLARFNEAMARETENKTLDPDTVRAGVENMFNDSTRGFYLVAEEEDALVGSLMVTTEWSDWRNGTFWWIQSVYVRPRARRTGVYTALHHAVRARAKAADDVCGLRLYVERDNEVAQETYEALGMTKAAYRMYEEML
jgi:ribosomal protein S18 acetylase RimI-like enzyme